MASNLPPAKKPNYMPSDKSQAASDRAYDQDMANQDGTKRSNRPRSKPQESKNLPSSQNTDRSINSNGSHSTSDHTAHNNQWDNSTESESPNKTSVPAPKTNPSAEYLESLPIKSVMVGGIKKRGRYDKDTHYVYLEDGTIVRVNPAKKPPAPKDEPSGERPSPESKPQQLQEPEQPKRISDGRDHQEDGVEQSHSTKKGFRSRKDHDPIEKAASGTGKKKAVFVALIAAAAIGVFGYQFLSGGGTGPSETPLIQTGPTTEVEVVQLTQDVIAGTQITEDLIEPYVISAESFNQISLSGVNLYQWDRKDTLLGMYVSKYIPRGQYLSYDSLVAAYESPQNIFGELEEGKYIDIPIQLKEGESANFVPGAAFDVTVRKSTLVENPGAGEANTIDGMDHTTSVEQSVRIDEYKLSSVIAVDVIAADGTSMYQTLSSLLSIPAGEQEHYIEAHSSDPAFISSVTPASIRVSASQAQIDTLGDMNNENTECIFSFLEDNADKSNNEKADFFVNARVLSAQLQEYIPVSGGEQNE